jgi:hypothetical protein
MSLAAEPVETVPRLPPWTEEAALAYLRERREVRGSQTWLGEQWGWPKQKVNRYLEKWLKHKFVRFRGAGQKRMLVYLTGAPTGDAVGPPAPLPPANDPKPPVAAREATARIRDAAPPRPVTVAAAPVVTVAPPVLAPDPIPSAAPVPRGVPATGTVTLSDKLLAFLVFLIGASFAVGSLWLNGTSWHSFVSASNPEAGVLLAMCGLLVGALAILSPSAASRSPRRSYRIMFLVIWVVAAAMETATAVAFLHANVGNAVGSRQEIIDERARIAEQTAALKEALAKLGDFQRASPAQAAAATAVRERACKIGQYCKKATEDEKTVLANRTSTERADELKTELAAQERKGRILPLIAAADPLISGLIEVVTWMSAGSWAPSAQAIRNIWLLVFAAALSLSPGPLVAGALGLVRR